MNPDAPVNLVTVGRKDLWHNQTEVTGVIFHDWLGDERNKKTEKQKNKWFQNSSISFFLFILWSQEGPTVLYWMLFVI